MIEWFFGSNWVFESEERKGRSKKIEESVRDLIYLTLGCIFYYTPELAL